MHEPTLTEVLERNGYTHRATSTTGTTGRHEVMDRAGTVVTTGRADEVWAWLRDRGLWPEMTT